MNYELIILMVLPIALALPMYMVGRKNTSLAKWLTTLIIGSTTFYSMWLWVKHFAGNAIIYNSDDGEAGFKMLYKAEWIPDLGVKFAVGADGLSMPLIVLTQVVFLVSVVSSFYVKDQEATYYALILVLNSAVIGTFVALDLLLFYIAWELVLVPMFFLIHIWGGDNRKYAAIKFFIYTHLASLVMLIGLFYIYIEGGSTFYLPDLKDNFTNGSISFGTISLIFWLVFIGFVTKFPQVPVHTWLPDAHVQAPSPGSAILAGLLLKMGGYGLMRVGFWLLAGAQEDGEYFFDSAEGERIRIIIAIVGVVSMVYPAFVALRQDDLKRMIAYSSISHMGIVLLGLAAYNTNGFNAAMFMMIAHGVISPALFLLSGVIEHNTKSHTRLMSKVGGLGHKMPFVTGLFVFMGFASAGLPGLAGFVAEFAAFLGMFESELLTDGIHLWIPVIAVMSIIVTAGYYLWAIQKVLFNEPTGELDNAEIAKWWETGPILVLAIFTLVLGLYPKLVYGTLDDWSNSIPGLQP
ncbi:MAG: F(420)H(2) dehydrogenase subunit M [Candidatus Heimdallarchaeota archaeon LC_2]|nr:MAG: F(420)H(2) dehydrogenase subunit M [Candidatus Heimdallarchaeota archaeon LC_2]